MSNDKFQECERPVQLHSARFPPTCLNCHFFRLVENELGMGECGVSGEVVSCDYYCDKYETRYVTLGAK